MARKSSKKTAVVMGRYLYTDDEATGALLDSEAWFTWLTAGSTFYLDGVTFRAEMRRQGFSWYAFKKIGGRTRKAYVGRQAALTAARLNEIVASFSQIVGGCKL